MSWPIRGVIGGRLQGVGPSIRGVGPGSTRDRPEMPTRGLIRDRSRADRGGIWAWGELCVCRSGADLASTWCRSWGDLRALGRVSKVDLGQIRERSKGALETAPTPQTRPEPGPHPPPRGADQLEARHSVRRRSSCGPKNTTLADARSPPLSRPSSFPCRCVAPPKEPPQCAYVARMQRHLPAP